MEKNRRFDVTSILLASFVLLSSFALLTTTVGYPVVAQPGAMYWKPSFIDYAPSGVPDFDQRQWGTYMWTDQWGAWSHCGPVAVANSLWWLDSEFEPNPDDPPTINDGFPLVQSYSPQWDDHDRLNVPPLVEHLAFLMDTDGRRTGLNHDGTNVNDMQAGLTHYLSWTGVNPRGDVNGDGIVDQLDVNIVQAALGSIPGQVNWNLAADIFPASTTYPPAADNVIDMQDLMLVGANMGNTGLFYEHTVMQPDFFFIEEEVKRCQDVVLLVGYWIFDEYSGYWYREPGGHYVTVAGVDSTNIKLALSDPVQDAFESGLIPEGRIPFPHPHLPPEPPYITHNDAAYVSQDIYSVSQITPPWPPCPGGNWAIVNFASWRPAPPFFAVIESAVVTSPLVEHDVAVINVSKTKTVVCQGYTCNISVTVENQGDFAETFNLTAYANTTMIQTEIVSMALTSTATVNFTWDATGWAKGNYSISAYAWPVIGECLTEDNNFTDGWIVVSMVGDLTHPLPSVWDFVPDGKVGGADGAVVSRCFGASPETLPPMRWEPNCDINNNGKNDGIDKAIVYWHFGEGGP
jgi:hypothetical protein